MHTNDDDTGSTAAIPAPTGPATAGGTAPREAQQPGSAGQANPLSDDAQAAADDALVQAAFDELLAGYMASNHRKKKDIIVKAFNFARSAHAGVRRRSGEPYIMHPIAVARIVSQEIGLGSTSICSALLHDVVEDTEYTVEDIESQFGPKIAQIVEGLTKISGGIFGDKASVQAENFRKLLLTMASDIRVILVKMADRLHNMRTLGSMLPAKRIKIAGETLYIYAPLAHRLGLFAIKTELEDLSFRFEHPREYEAIAAKVKGSEEYRNQLFESFAAPIRSRLDARNLKYEMRARVKSVYSIWKKMDARKIPFEEVYDLYAARIVFDCPNEADEKRICWNIYSDITDIYRLHPERIRDWISTPKANGYRALHLTVMGPDGNWIEVQIRSRKMDDIAERGFAAHWKYKIGEGEEDSELTKWIKTIEEILDNPEPNSIDFLDTLKLNLFSTEIVVFTPKGDTITLPNGATVLDLAFSLHSEIGTHCMAAKVNRKLVPNSYKLHSGDQVEVLTASSPQVKPDWLKFVVTAKGKTRLRQALRRSQREVVNRGESIYLDFLKANDIEPSNDVLTKVLGMKQMRNRDELYMAIGRKEILLDDHLAEALKATNERSLLRKLLRNPFASKPKPGALPKLPGADSQPPPNPDNTINVDAINRKRDYVLTTINNRSNYVLAGCCHPIAGDDVLAYLDHKHRQVVVHKLTCPIAARLKASDGGNVLSARWQQSLEKFLVHISIEGIDRFGILQEIIQTISSSLGIDIRNLNINTADGLFTARLDALVGDTKAVNDMCQRLDAIEGVTKAVRTNS